MRRVAAVALGLLLLAASAGAAPVRAQIGTFDDVWVAHRGVAYGAGGSSCSHPHFVADGVDDQVQLKAALLDTNPSGVVHVCPGTYHLSTPMHVTIDHVVTISGAGERRTILDGGARYRNGVRVSVGSDILDDNSSDATLTINNLTVQNGGNDFMAVFVSRPLVVDHVRFYRNQSDPVRSGGAISGNTITVTNSSFIDNVGAQDGGAISGTHVEVSGSLFRGNSTNGKGGAIYAASVVVTDSRFTGNVSRGMVGCIGGGGAIYARGSVTINSGTFDRNRADAESCAEADPEWATNSAGFGGAVYLGRSSPAIGFINNATFSRNSAAFAGGAVASLGELNLARLTFTANASGGWGGALFYIGHTYGGLASSFSAHRALLQISLIHHHCIVQQLLADGRRQLSRINVVGANLLPRNVVDGKIHLAPAFFLAAVAGAVPTLRSIFVCRTVT